MTGWKARAAPFAGTWPMWLLIVAVVSGFAGCAVGAFHSAPGGTSSAANANAVKGLATPGGAYGPDVSFQKARGQPFPQSKGERAGPLDCPGSDDVTSTLTATVRGEDSLTIDTTLHVTLNGVWPPRPPVDMNEWLQRPEGAEDLASCFIATDADITSLTWADGKVDVDLNLLWDDATGYTNDLLKTVSSTNHATLTVDICAPHPEWAAGIRIICQTGANNVIVVRVNSPVQNVQSTPFPDDQSQQDGYLNTTWRFAGPMPAVTVILDAPMTVLARSWLHWNRTHDLGLPLGTVVSVDPYYIADSTAIWLALIATAVLLRGKRTSAEPLRADRRLLLIVLAGLLLGVQLDGLYNLNGPYANGVVVVATWALLSAAVAPKRVVRAIVAISVAALASLISISAIPSMPDAAVYTLLTVFSVFLATLVITTAWALWRQVRTLFDLADVDGRRVQWQIGYRRVIDGLMVATFLFAVGFPVGETLNWWLNHRHHFPLGVYIADDLILSTGVRFRAVLGWVSILLAISYLAGYWIHRSLGRAVPPRADWLRLTRSVRNRTVGALAALTLCLSAPWATRFALGVAVPVWMAQFAILWLAFTSLITRAQLRGSRSSRSPQAMVVAATGSPGQKPLASGEGSRIAEVSPQPPPPSERAADFRQLVRGPRRGLAQAKSATQIALILAVIPVGYLVWTTLPQLTGQLRSNVGILSIAVFAVFEFARWVISGFLFGYLYEALPGRIGPVKALVFAGIWILSCLGPLVFAQSSSGSSILTQEVIYRSAQFALFAIVLAVVIDLRRVTAGGGTWRDVQDAYDLQGYGRVAAAVTPVALLALTLAQQIIAHNSGFEVGKTLLSGITSVLQVPGR